MEKLLDFIAAQGLLPVLGVIAILLLLFLVILVVVALKQGRAVSLGPVRLGGRLKGQKGENSASARVASSVSQYLINCSYCGTQVPVSNPRLKQVPVKVYPSTDGCSSGANSHGFAIGCPKCGRSQYVQFEY
jgi:hypothetical protein